MCILSQVSIENAIAFLKSHLKKNKFFIKIGNDSFSKFSGSKRGNKVYAHLTELKIKPIVESLVKNKTAKFLTLTHQYDYKNPVESWTYMKKEIPKFVRKCKFNAYLYVFESHKLGGCHCHIIAINGISNEKVKQLWQGHIKIKKIKSSKIGAYLTKEIGKAGHVETALKHADKGILTDSDYKKIWRFYYLLKMQMRGWGCSRNLKTSEFETNEPEKYNTKTVESATRDSITNMNNSTGDKLRRKRNCLVFT